MGLAREAIHLDEGDRVRCLSGCRLVGDLRHNDARRSALAVGHPNGLGRVFGDYGTVAYLGSRASGTVLYDFHSTAMAKLAGPGRIHNCRLFGRACGTFPWRRCWISDTPTVVDLARHSFIDSHRHLYCLSLCAGEGARHVAEPSPASAPVGAGILARERSTECAGFVRTSATQLHRVLVVPYCCRDALNVRDG